jgi:Chitobiase/beta-hexosaminidase C-terminal domain
MESSFARTRTARRRARVVISAAAALGATAAMAAPAGAVVNGSHAIAVLPDTQGLELSGYPLPDTLNVHVIRNGITIGSATGPTTQDRKDPTTGDLNIAGGAPPCWTGSTPQILPGDEVTVDDGGTAVDSMIVQDVGATSLEQDPVTKHILVHGFAIAPGGGPFDSATFAANVQARITISTGSAFSNGKNTIRAGGGKFDGTIAYDPPALNGPAPSTWTADFPAPGPDAQLALGSKDFEGVYTVGVSEVTIGRQPLVASGCPAPVSTAVTSIPAFVNAASASSPMTIAGVADAANVSAVSVALHNKTYPATPAADGTWSVTVPGADVAALPEGSNAVTTSFTTAPGGAGAPNAVDTVVKDTVAPDAPTATPPPKSYPSAQSVSLEDADTTATMHYTTGSGAPSTAFHPGSPISVTASQTIRATATDPAGNTSPVASLAYTITSAPVTTPPAGGGTTTIIQILSPPAAPVAPVAPAGQGVAGAGAKSPARPAVSGMHVAVGKGHALRVSLRLGSGANVVRFQVFRAKSGRPGGRALATLTRLATGRAFTGTLRGAALRGLRPGRYVLVAQAGANPSALGAAARVTFTVR